MFLYLKIHVNRMVLREKAYSCVRFIPQNDTDQREADRKKAMDNE